jgi:NADPH2:quinone reductase
MRALRVHDLTGPDGLRLDEIAVPPDREDGTRVRVAVSAAGVGFVDTLLARGLFQCPLRLPFAPGLEISGRVTHAPLGCGFVVGDPVIGYVPTGGFADVAWVRPEMLAPLPQPLSWVEAAAMVVNYHTAVLALDERARLRAGETVLVHGAGGGLGSAAVQIAVALGARVVAVAGTPERRAVAEAAGAHTMCGHDDWFDAVRAAGGVDVIIDPVGGEVFEHSVHCLAPQGRLITVGSTSGTVATAAAGRLLLSNAGVLGFSLPEMLARDHTLFARTAKQLAVLVDGGLRPLVTATYPLPDGARALREIEDQTSAGKLVLTTG